MMKNGHNFVIIFLGQFGLTIFAATILEALERILHNPRTHKANKETNVLRGLLPFLFSRQWGEGGYEYPGCSSAVFEGFFTLGELQHLAKRLQVGFDKSFAETMKNALNAA